MTVATPEEVSAWSFEEIQAEIQALLPEGSVVLINRHEDGYWVSKVERTTPEGVVVVDLEEPHVDRRLSALNLYGQFGFKAAVLPEGSAWVRRREQAHPIATRTTFEAVADPEDLDPNEVDLVYQAYLNK